MERSSAPPRRAVREGVKNFHLSKTIPKSCKMHLNIMEIMMFLLIQTDVMTPTPLYFFRT
jgi:hypothetical protein